jgi:hypothetical protein
VSNICLGEIPSKSDNGCLKDWAYALSDHDPLFLNMLSIWIDDEPVRLNKPTLDKLEADVAHDEISAVIFLLDGRRKGSTKPFPLEAMQIIGGLPALKHILIRNHKGQNFRFEKGAFAGLADCQNLESFSFDRPINRRDLASLANLPPKLTKLHLIYNSNSKDSPLDKMLRNQTKLESLTLMGRGVNNKTLEAIATLPTLKKLELSPVRSELPRSRTNLQITATGLRHLGQSPSLGQSLELLDISEANIKSLVDKNGTNILEQLSSLKGLDMSNVPITDKDLSFLHKNINLESIWLNGTKITDNGVKKYMASLPNLWELNVSDTKITDESLKVFATCPKLRYLILENTFITVKGLSYLHDHPTLRDAVVPVQAISSDLKTPDSDQDFGENSAVDRNDTNESVDKQDRQE